MPAKSQAQRKLLKATAALIFGVGRRLEVAFDVAVDGGAGSRNEVE